MENNLRFRRQFLLARENVKGLDSWQHVKFRENHLFIHPDLEATVEEEGQRALVLLGYVFDPFSPGRTSQEIVKDLFSRAESLEDLTGFLKPLAGRYALFFAEGENIIALNDPLGLREIYYCTLPNKVVCGSQPNLLSSFSEPVLGPTIDKSILDFYNNDMGKVREGRLWIGDETCFKGIKHLVPNHYLDLQSMGTRRYWPNRMLQEMELSESVSKACEYLQGVMEAVTCRFDTMMAVTSGVDSRSLLAASRGVKDRIYYFINKEPPMTDEHPDIRIPKAMFQKIDVPFHVHEVPRTVDADFKKTFLDNVFMSTERILPTIYNVYFMQHPGKVNLLGVGEIGREFFGPAPPDLDGYYLARSLKYKKSAYASEQCQKWLDSAWPVAIEFNVDIMRLFLWEGLLATWGVVGNSESDIAIEEFDPYNSHYIYEILLSLGPGSWRDGIFHLMIKDLWPELLEFPFNPPSTLGDRVKNWLQRMGLYFFLKRQIYRYERRRVSSS